MRTVRKFSTLRGEVVIKSKEVKIVKNDSNAIRQKNYYYRNREAILYKKLLKRHPTRAMVLSLLILFDFDLPVIPRERKYKPLKSIEWISLAEMNEGESIKGDFILR